LPTDAGVTVVIPTHNRPQLMQRALESVLTQDYPGEIEAVVVFDACEPFDPPVEVPPGRSVRTTVNTRTRGLAGARNTGILAATQEYVAFLDDDDFWFPGKLKAQMPLFDNEPRPVLVATAMLYDDGERPYERLVPKDVVEYKDLLRDRVAGIPSGAFVMEKSQLLGELGMVDEEIPGSYGEDYDMMLRAAYLAPIPVVNRPYVSVTWARNSYYFGRWGLYADALEFLLRKHPDFESDAKGYGRVAGQIAFARAANGERKTARTWVKRSLTHDKTQIRAWLALAVALRLLPARFVIRTVQRMGKGI
jgi:glycosyltransferase involved in cell wall biosynthesis